MRLSVKEIKRNLDGPPKNKELGSYVVKIEFSRPKCSSVYSPQQSGRLNSYGAAELSEIHSL